MRTTVLSLCLLSGCAAFFQGAGENLTVGAARVLGEPDPQVARLVQQIGDEVAKVTREKLDPVMREAVRGIVESALDAAFDPARTQRGEDLVAGLAARVTDVVTEGMAEGTRERLGPALRASLQEQLGPGIAELTRVHVGPAIGGLLRDDVGPATGQLLEKDVRPVLGGLARDMARGATEELAASLEEGGRLDKALARQRGLVRGDIEDTVDGSVTAGSRAVDTFAERALGALGVGSLVLGAVAAGVAWLWWTWRKKAMAYEQTVALLTTAIQQHAGQDGVGTLVEALRGLDRTADGPAALDQFLNERPWLKVKKEGEPRS